jgi:hypothetical protein
MQDEHRVRALCAKAVATEDLDDLDENLSQLRAVLREHFARIEEMIETRCRRAEFGREVDESA